MSEPNITLISLKCPNCGAELSIESGRNQAFCSYCGAKVLVTNQNEHVRRIVDEAAIKRAENERLRIENEERKRKMEFREDLKDDILFFLEDNWILFVGIIGFAALLIFVFSKAF